MADITHGTWIKDGKAVDAVYQDGVKVYGRNLYTDTRDFDNPSLWPGLSNWYKTGERFNGLTVIATDNDWNGLGQTVQAKKGETYTFSAYARYKSGTGQSMMFFNVNGSDTGTPVSLNETWQRVTYTMTLTDDSLIRAHIDRTNNNTNTLLIAGLKLERGTISTPYSPAPEDVM